MIPINNFTLYCFLEEQFACNEMLIFTERSFAQWTQWHTMLCVMYTFAQKAALLSGIFPLKVHYKDGWWVHASSPSSSSSLSLLMLIVMTVIIVIFILLIIMMIIIGCPCALPRERLGVCDQWRQQGGVYSLQVGLLLSPSDDHRLIIMIICNLYFPFPFLIIFPISSYCAQFGSQLAGLALNVKKKMPRGEVTVKTI